MNTDGLSDEEARYLTTPTSRVDLPSDLNGQGHSHEEARHLATPRPRRVLELTKQLRDLIGIGRHDHNIASPMRGDPDMDPPGQAGSSIPIIKSTESDVIHVKSRDATVKPEDTTVLSNHRILESAQKSENTTSIESVDAPVPDGHWKAMRTVIEFVFNYRDSE